MAIFKVMTYFTDDACKSLFHGRLP